MASIFSSVRWTNNNPAIYLTYNYTVGTRRGDSVDIYPEFIVHGISGTSYYGYTISANLYLNGVLVWSGSIKGGSPSQWSNIHIYPGWKTIGVGATTTSMYCQATMYTNGAASRNGVSYGGTAYFPIGWTSIGNPGSVTFPNEWSESSFTATWAAAADGVNNPVQNYGAIVYGSDDEGVNWTELLRRVDLGRTTQLYYDISNDPEGRWYKVSTSAYGVYNAVGWIPGQNPTKKNYAPRPLSVITPADNSMVVADTPILLSESSDPGGSAYEDGLLRYRYQIASGENFSNLSTSNFQTDLTFNSSLNSHVGHEIRVQGQAYDGWVYSPMSDYNTVKVGKVMTISAPTVSTSQLSNLTTFTVPAPYVDSTYRLYNITENIVLQYSTDNVNWINLQTTSRTSANAIINSITFSNIMYLLYEKNSALFLNSGDQTFYFKTVHTAGHLSATSEIITLEYLSPVLNVALTHADNSMTLKFPMNNTIPVTEQNVGITHSIQNWTSGNIGTFQIQVKNTSSSTWTTVYSKSVLESYSSIVSLITLASMGLSRGQTCELRASLKMTIGNTSVDFYLGALTWNVVGQADVDKNKIELRPIPNITRIENASNFNFIQNNRDENRASMDYTLTWDPAKAFVITQNSIIVTDAGYVSTITETTKNPRLLFSITDPTIRFATSYVEISERPQSDKTWTVLEGVPTDMLIEADPQNLVRGNSENIAILCRFTVKEVFRSTPTAIEPRIDLQSAYSQSLSLTSVANTVCLPQFNEGTISFDRVLS